MAGDGEGWRDGEGLTGWGETAGWAKDSGGGGGSGAVDRGAGSRRIFSSPSPMGSLPPCIMCKLQWSDTNGAAS